MGVKRFANSEDFLEVLNLALGPQTPRGLNTLVDIEPLPVNVNSIISALEEGGRQEEYTLKQRQLNPNYQRQLHGWNYDDTGRAYPKNDAEYARAYELAASLDSKSLGKLLGGYGGERGNAPTGPAGVEAAADYLYNASYGFDTLTGGPLNNLVNAGHIEAFNKHGSGAVRPEQEKVNKRLGDKEGLDKLLYEDDAIDKLRTAQLYAKYPEEMTALLGELPHSKRQHKGWNPELKEMRQTAASLNLI